MAPLLARKSGVDHAFERLYRRHAVDVYRYALAVLRNGADAEDVTQTTFMNAYRALERGERPSSPHNWLIAIAHNVCRQRFRQALRRPLEVGLEDDVADRFVEPEDDHAPSPEDIRRALQHLAFNQRAALVMRELEGRSYAEIADLLDVSVSAVETLIFRARRALREQLEVTLTCGQAEQLISRQLDGALARSERSQLRAHLRECATCRKVARSQRAQRSALKALGGVPLPSSLASLFGGGANVATSVGTTVAVKAAAAVITAGVATGVGLDAHHRLAPPSTHHRAAPAHPAVRQASPATPAPRHAHVEAAAVQRAQPLRRAAHPVARATTHRTHAVPAARERVTTKRHAGRRPVAVERAPAAKSRGQGGARRGRPAHAPALRGSPGRGHVKNAPTRPVPAATEATSAARPGRAKQHGPANLDGRLGGGSGAAPPRSREQSQGQGGGEGQGRGKGKGEEATQTSLVPTVTTATATIPDVAARPAAAGGRGH